MDGATGRAPALLSGAVGLQRIPGLIGVVTFAPGSRAAWAATSQG